MQQAAYQDKPVQRADIQALRGYAVLLVLVYHAGLGIAEGGYLGVDVFFVISGYLITKLIKERIEANKFTFREFYFRRAKRLLPAAYVTYLVTAIAAPYFLTPQSFVDFMWQLTGALTFSANIVLWKQTGYFEIASELKPLLHIWSLAIEEQYYLLLPPVMVMLPKRWWVPCASIVVVGSLVLCWFSVGWKPSATFYLLPTRGWELAIGSVGALWKIPDHFAKVLTRIFWPAVALVCIIPFALIGTYHPGIDALIVCIATLVIVLANNETAAASAIVRLFAVFGNFSYSLYLVHWPIFAFASNAYLREVPWEARLLCFSVSLIFGYLLYRLIEKPFRQVEVQISGRELQ